VKKLVPYAIPLTRKRVTYTSISIIHRTGMRIQGVVHVIRNNISAIRKKKIDLRDQRRYMIIM
jgi:hypothetical protein